MSRHTCSPSSSSPFTPIKQLYQPSAAHGGASGSARPDRPRIPTSRWLRRCSTQSSPVQDAGGPRRKRRAWPQAKRNPHDGRRGDIQRRGQRPERLRRDRAKPRSRPKWAAIASPLCMACSRGCRAACTRFAQWLYGTVLPQAGKPSATARAHRPTRQIR